MSGSLRLILRGSGSFGLLKFFFTHHTGQNEKCAALIILYYMSQKTSWTYSMPGKEQKKHEYAEL